MELLPSNALIVKADGGYSIDQIVEPKERKACSFERIYFSRGSDEKIYRERIALGHHLSDTVLKAIDYDLKNTIFLLFLILQKQLLWINKRRRRLPE